MIGYVLGSYRIVAKIGGGGMGNVYAAEHTTLGRRVAIKVLLPDLSRNADMVGRMFAEARAAASMKHPGLVDVHDFGRLPDGSAFIVMELLEGETLAARLHRFGQLGVDEALAIGRQVAGAVGAVHQRGIIHRDLKPDNIFLVPEPELAGGTRAKVLDFGIAKLSDDGVHHSVRTQTGVLMGTPAYMSPEQCRGASAVDSRSDIYSLGCIVFEMLTGQPPFVYQGMGEVIAAHMFSDPRAPSAVVAVPPWLDEVVVRMLAKRPEDRPQRMEDVAVHFGGARISVPPVSQSYPLISVSPTPTAIAPRPPRRWRALVGGLLGSAALTGGILGIVHAQRSSEPPRVVAAEAPAPAPAPPAPAPPAPVPPAPAPPAPEPVATKPEPPPVPTTIKVRLTSAPEGAEVYRAADGVQVGVTPFEQELPRGDGKAVYIVKLAGYQEERAVVPTDQDGALELTLVKVKGSTSSTKPSSSGTRPKAKGGADDPIDPFGRGR